jgi:hypothetical protein
MDVLHILLSNFSLSIETLIILRKVHPELQAMIDNPNNGNINSKNLYKYMYFHPFTEGLVYQLLKDNYNYGRRPIEGRKYSIKEFVKDDFEDHTARLSWAMQYKGGKWRNNWNFYKSVDELLLFLEIVDKNGYKNNGLKDPKYFGQCVQFLLDINHKKSYTPEEIIDYNGIISLAERKWHEINYPKDKTVNHNFCDSCDIWYTCDRRCECNNRRLMWESNTDSDNLNDIPYFYVIAY